MITIAELIGYLVRTHADSTLPSRGAAGGDVPGDLRGGDDGADRLRVVHHPRLPGPDDRGRSPGDHLRHPRERNPDPRALRVPHRRGVRLAQVRVRPAAGLGVGDHPAGGRRGHLHARPRGQGHRPDQQAQGLPAAGRRTGHLRREPRTGAPRGRARLQRRRRHPGGPRPVRGAGDHEQPRQGAADARARHHRDRTGAVARGGRTVERRIPGHQAGQDGPQIHPRPGRARRWAVG